jgi:hypothetical protein
MDPMAGCYFAARMHMHQTPGFSPLDYVELIHLHGGPVPFVVSRGFDVFSPEGNAEVQFHSALYYVAREWCDAHEGDQPYRPSIYRHAPPNIVNVDAGYGADLDPNDLVEEEEVVQPDEVLEEPVDLPGQPEPDQVAIEVPIARVPPFIFHPPPLGEAQDPEQPEGNQ